MASYLLLVLSTLSFFCFFAWQKQYNKPSDFARSQHQ